MTAAADHDAAKQETWTTRRLLRWIDAHLGSKGVESPRVCAEMLVGHVLATERMRLYMESDRPATPPELERLRALVQRAARHEPVQYLVGEAWFWSKRFAVGPETLIPRPATEHLVEEAARAARALATARAESTAGPAPLRMLEIGTGTGCISICVAAALGGQRQSVPVQIVATDIVHGALVLARANAQAHGVEQVIDFRSGSLFVPLHAHEQGRFDLVVSNPPYVADDEWQELAPNVRDFEPRSALAGGVGGMEVLTPLIAQAHRWLRPGGRLILEVGARQHDAVLAATAANRALTGAQMCKDFEGYWRMLVADRAAEAA